MGDDRTRVTATLPRKDVEFLDELGMDCKEQGGKMLSRCEVVRALIKAAQNLDVEPDDLREEK